MEIDCLVVVQTLKAKILSGSLYFSLFIYDCKDLLNELQYISYKFVRKPTNVIAHTIARAANSMPSFEWDMPYSLFV